MTYLIVASITAAAFWIACRLAPSSTQTPNGFRLLLNNDPQEDSAEITGAGGSEFLIHHLEASK